MKSSLPILFCRRLAASILYLFIRIGLPLHACLVGYKRSLVGKCLILAPPNRMQTILEGITFLQALDPKMFQRLTAERQYVFWYHPKQFLQCREVFSLTDNFLLWGKEGVAICFVQCVLDFTLDYLPFAKTLRVDPDVKMAARREIQQELLTWMSEHSFSAELIRQYEEIANKYRKC